MDNELRNFRLKVSTIPKGKAFVWIVESGLKLSLHYIKRKFFRTSKRSYDFSSVHTSTDRIVLKRLNFLRENDQQKFILKKLSTSRFNWQEQFQDEQDLHLLHRLRDLPFYTFNDKSFTPFTELIQDWRDKNPTGTLPGWHPYTLSERLISLSWASIFGSQRIDKSITEFQELLAAVCADQASFLRGNFEFQLGHHNHLINNARALLTAATLLGDLPEAVEWKRYAMKVFVNEWPYQLLSDGVHAEQSVTYHFLLTRTLWEMKYLMEQNGDRFPFDDDCTKMIRYATVITRPDGTIPFIGHLTPDWHWKELVGLLPVWGEDVVPVSDLGRLYKQTSGKPSASNHLKVLIFPSAGQGILRTEKIHAVLCCDPRGVVTVHGDQNLLGLDLWYSGTHLIRDAGLASYNLDERRAWYESWQGQSTFSIDGFDPIVSNWRKRQLPNDYYKVTTTLQGDEEASMVEASHTGYCRLPDPVTVGRQINVRSDSELYIVDSLQSKAQHSYSANFHFGNNLVKQLTERSIQIRDLANGNTFELQWNADLEFVLEKNPFAVAYGEELIGTTGTFKCTFTGNIKIEYLLKPV